MIILVEFEANLKIYREKYLIQVHISQKYLNDYNLLINKSQYSIGI